MNSNKMGEREEGRGKGIGKGKCLAIRVSELN